MRARLHVVSTETLAAAVEEARRAGFTVVDECEVANTPWDLSSKRFVCIVSANRARASLLASRGAGVIVLAPPDKVELALLVDDLARLGEVSVRLDPPVLGADERELLELLGSGLSVTEAARRLFISRRTATRRLSTARAALGAETTAAAILRARDAGRHATDARG